jgi:hypothetical protein
MSDFLVFAIGMFSGWIVTLACLTVKTKSVSQRLSGR